ncbi:MAG: hypothetical protein WCO81_03510 [Cyanobacteriota bacterium ELA615]
MNVDTKSSKTKLSERYVPIHIIMDLHYREFTKEKERKFKEGLSYIIGSVDICNFTHWDGCVSCAFEIPLTAAMILFQSEHLKESGKKTESRTVLDLTYFIDNFNIRSIACSNAPKEIFLTTERVVEHFSNSSNLNETNYVNVELSV